MEINVNYNITYFEMIQISLEAMGAAFCIVCIIALLAYGKTKITNTTIKLLLLNTILQISDACAYIFRGNTDPFSITMTRMSNYLVFAMQLIMTLYFTRLTLNLLGIYETVSAKRIMIFANVAASVSFVLITVNLFTGFTYYFDESNYYHRNTGWYFYTFIILLIGAVLLIFVISNRKKINRALLISILVYILVPIFLSFFQILFYGISLNNFALTISLMFILYIYIRMVKDGNKSSDNNTGKKITSSMIMLSMLILILSTSVLFNIRGIQKNCS